MSDHDQRIVCSIDGDQAVIVLPVPLLKDLSDLLHVALHGDWVINRSTLEDDIAADDRLKEMVAQIERAEERVEKLRELGVL